MEKEAKSFSISESLSSKSSVSESPATEPAKIQISVESLSSSRNDSNFRQKSLDTTKLNIKQNLSLKLAKFDDDEEEKTLPYIQRINRKYDSQRSLIPKTVIEPIQEESGTSSESLSD